MPNYSLLVECSDYDCIYGIIEHSCSTEELQDAIYEMKASYDIDSGWTIYDVIEDIQNKYPDYDVYLIDYSNNNVVEI